MKPVTAIALFVFLVGTMKLFQSGNSWEWCSVLPLFVSMAHLHLSLTGIVLRTSEFVFCVWFCNIVPCWTIIHSHCPLSSCHMCHSNKLESVFECEVSRLLYDEGEVEYWMYEPVDLTEQSATNAATGSTMQGDLTECSVCFDFKCQLGKNISPHPPLIFLQGFQLIQKEIIIGSRENLQSVSFVKKSSTLCLVFSCIIKLILLNGMGRKYYSQWSMRFLVSFVLTLTFRKTILISIRFWALIRSPSNHFLYLSSIFASQLTYCFVLFAAQTG